MPVLRRVDPRCVSEEAVREALHVLPHVVAREPAPVGLGAGRVGHLEVRESELAMDTIAIQSANE